ncbi:MAG: tetratricopeptide repeat protein [Verrucomicrobiales bacterium]
MQEIKEPPPYRLPRGVPKEQRRSVPQEALAAMEALYEQGLYVQAYEKAKEWGPLLDWAGADARIFAGRLAGNLGASRLRRWLIFSAYQEAPTNPKAALFYAYEMSGSHGSVRTLEFLDQWVLDLFPDEVRADCLAIRARLYAGYRDFEGAERYIKEAFEFSQSAWIWTEQAYVHHLADDRSASLQAVDRALQVNPAFRPAIQHRGALLLEAERTEEAIAFLHENLQKLETDSIAAQLSAIYSDREDAASALQILEFGEPLAKLIEPPLERWYAARRADALYLLGRGEEALEQAQRVGYGFYGAFAEHLKDDLARGKPGRRVRLQVPFVAQDYLTCGPASLATISAFWGLERPQHDIVDAICYDGTMDHAERAWAEETGLIVREFQVQPEVTRVLTERGMPFALSTSETVSAHLQVAIGFDEVRDSLLMRDPSYSHYTESWWKDFLERYESTGPRGMLMVPKDRATELDGVTLPDAELYDQLYQLHRALHRHDRDRAAAVLQGMQSAQADHRLSLFAERSLAFYDGNMVRELHLIREQRKRYEKCPRLAYAEQACLRSLGRRKERLELLESMVIKPKDPIFLRELGSDLVLDGRTALRGRRLLQRATRLMPRDAGTLFELAHAYWSLGAKGQPGQMEQVEERRQEACRLYRFAACLAQTNPHYAWSYFQASRYVRGVDEAVAFLRSRFENLGKKSGEPGLTLFRALLRMDRAQEAFEILDQSLNLRPDDGDLLLQAADEFARWGKLQRAEELLQRAESKSHPGQWLSAAAAIAMVALKDQEARLHLDALLTQNPLSQSAHRDLAGLIERSEGLEHALEHLKKVVTEFPDHVGLRELLCEHWKRVGDAEGSIQALRELLELCPGNGWAQRELALQYAYAEDLDSALSEATEATRLEPDNSYAFSVLGRVFEMAEREQEAVEAYRRSIELSVDNSASIEGMVRLHKGAGPRRECLAWIRAQILEQPIFGDALTAYHTAAFPILEPLELLQQLEHARENRPDLWEAWMLCARHLSAMGQIQEALNLTQEMTQRFPLTPGTWAEYGVLLGRLEKWREAAEAFDQAAELNPSWTRAAREGMEMWERAEDPEKAESLIRRAVQRAPQDPVSRGFLAELLWRLDRRQEAIDELKHAARLDLAYSWAWSQLDRWSVALGQETNSLMLAQELVQEKPQHPLAHIRLAECYFQAPDLDKRLAAIRQAITLDSRNPDHYDILVTTLTFASRYSEALEAASPSVFGNNLPLNLQGRKIWVLAQQGNLDQAIEKMRSLLEEHPYYEWGTNCLLTWLLNTEKLEEALPVAKQLVRLQPNQPGAFFELGWIHRQLKKPDEALEAFGTAFNLDPGHAGAAFQLFELYVERQEWQAAEALLRRMDATLGDAETQVAWARLYALRKLKNLSIPRARLVLQTPTVSVETLRRLRSALIEGGWKKDWRSEIQKFAQAPEVSPAVATLYVETLAGEGLLPSLDLVQSWANKGTVMIQPLGALLDAVGDQNKGKAWVPKLRGRFDTLLKESTFLWGKVGYALASGYLYDEVVEWLSDWKERSHVETWMLANLAYALMHEDRISEAFEVSTIALDSFARETNDRFHHAVLAAAYVIQGQAEAAEQHLTKLPDNLSESLTMLQKFSTCGVRVLKEPKAERHSIYKSQRKLLKKHLNPYLSWVSRIPPAQKKLAKNLLGYFEKMREA